MRGTGDTSQDAGNPGSGSPEPTGAGSVLPSPPLVSTPLEHFLFQSWGGRWTVRSRGSPVCVHVPLPVMPVMSRDPRAQSPAEGAAETRGSPWQ